MLVGLGTQPDFLQLDLGGVLARVALLLRLLVLEAAIVHQAAHGGRGHWRDFDEVDTGFARLCERFGRGENA